MKYGLSFSSVAPSSISCSARFCIKDCQKAVPTAGATISASLQAPSSTHRLQYASKFPAVRCASAASRSTSSRFAAPMPRAFTFFRISSSCALWLSSIGTEDWCGTCGFAMAGTKLLARPPRDATTPARSHSSATGPGGVSSPKSAAYWSSLLLEARDASMLAETAPHSASESVVPRRGAPHAAFNWMAGKAGRRSQMRRVVSRDVVASANGRRR
mmetsp:Transcript_14283/g.36986  ORF Transcript_14283/g.36986 Transcript_14283/m.36986 type:complete len:215 (-) Transcript_14283:58-702(-)